MKSTRSIAHTLLYLLAFASFSFAANPLSYPRGLALDRKGNLYIANSGGNNIVVFSPGYSRIPADTITQGTSNPTAVAFDPQGNLWVANYGTSNGGANGSISEYTNGVQNAKASITGSILGPTAMTIDGYGDLWVVNAYTNVTVYGATFAYAYPTS